MTKLQHQDDRQPLSFYDSRPRWYHYAIRRLRGSLLVSLVTLLFVFPCVIWLGMTVYLWITG